MKRIHTVATLCTCFTVFGCGGTGPSGAAPAPGPGPLAAGTEEEASVRSGNAHYDSVIEMLRGKAPGLQIVESSPGDFQIRIRGMSQSLQGSGQEPLVVVDGAPSGRPAGQALLTLNPDNVDRIQVLKDVASTSVYGTRGANGVILVTTKRREARER